MNQPEQLSIAAAEDGRIPQPARKTRSRSAVARASRRRVDGASSPRDGETPSELAAETAALPEDTEEALLERLGHGADYCRKVEEQLAACAGPELDAIMKLHRLIILKLSTQAEEKPALWDVLKDLMKPVMDWARLQEQQKERELAEKKYRDQVEAAKADAAAKDNPNATLKPETLEKIELELKLL